MRISDWPVRLSTFTILVVFAAVAAAELPSGFPGDVPVADYMEVVGVSEVRDDLMVDLHAPGQTLMDVVEWFRAGLTSAGWKSEGETISEQQAILAYSKNGRRCGVTVTNFVLNSSMQMDDSIKGITLQISGNAAPSDDSESASEAADASGNQE
jgi:hypothetical protein